jgi:hypothetical protein
MKPYQTREQDLGQHITMDIEEVDLANILDYVFLITNNDFTWRLYQPIRPFQALSSQLVNLVQTQRGKAKKEKK